MKLTALDCICIFLMIVSVLFIITAFVINEAACITAALVVSIVNVILVIFGRDKL